MIQIKGFSQAMIELEQLLEHDAKQIKKSLRGVVNKVSRHSQSQWAKKTVETVAVQQKNVKKTLVARRMENPMPAEEIVQKDSTRIPLKEFRPRQNKTGTSYKIAKGGKRGFIPGAFMGPKPGAQFARFGRGHVFTRRPNEPKVRATKGRYAGKMRQKIYKLYGPSMVGVTVVNEFLPVLAKDASERHEYELAREVRFRLLKKLGKI